VSSLFDFDLEEVQGPKEDPIAVIHEISRNCKACRLGQSTDKQNTGFIFAGPTTARIAILGDMPQVQGTVLSKRLPLAGDFMQELGGWLEMLGVAQEDVFILNVMQCKTSKSKAKDAALRAPYNEEIDVCFPDRALRVMRALPDLEVVITLGWVAAAALLGRTPEPRLKSHEGAWFGTDYLPGVAVFCLDHPREYGKAADARKRGRLRQHLEFFQSEYLRPSTAKIRKVLEIRQAERKANN